MIDANLFLKTHQTCLKQGFTIKIDSNYIFILYSTGATQ